MIEHSVEFKEMPKALLMAQKEITAAIKKSLNPHLKSKYADLAAVIDAVKEPLNAANISFLQYTAENTLKTTLLHESGEWVSATMPILFQKEKDPQAYGSGLTYAKRYSLQTLLGLPSEDDDGKAAAKPIESKAEQKINTDLPEPTEVEMEVLNMVWEKLLDSTPEGMTLNSEKIAKLVYGIKGAYVSDKSKVSTMVAYIAKQINSVCDVNEAVNG